MLIEAIASSEIVGIGVNDPAGTALKEGGALGGGGTSWLAGLTHTEVARTGGASGCIHVGAAAKATDCCKHGDVVGAIGMAAAS